MAFAAKARWGATLFKPQDSLVVSAGRLLKVLWQRNASMTRCVLARVVETLSPSSIAALETGRHVLGAET